jgi:hypothetical protein
MSNHRTIKAYLCMNLKLATVLKQTLYLAPDGVPQIKFSPRDVLGWPTLI